MSKLRLFLVTIFTIFVTLSYGQIKFKAATSVGGASLDRGTTFDYVIYANGNKCEYKLAIGAYGSNSWVRSQSSIDFKNKDFDQTAMIFNIKTSKTHHKKTFCTKY